MAEPAAGHRTTITHSAHRTPSQTVSALSIILLAPLRRPARNQESADDCGPGPLATCLAQELSKQDDRDALMGENGRRSRFGKDTLANIQGQRQHQPSPTSPTPLTAPTAYPLLLTATVSLQRKSAIAAKNRWAVRWLCHHER